MAVAMKQKPLSVSQGIPRTSVGGVVKLCMGANKSNIDLTSIVENPHN